jgi:hypothetical protein
MPEPLLNLDTIIVRPTIVIDGESYSILSADELSVLDSQRFALWNRRLEALQLGGEEDPELDQLVDTIARRVLVDVPDTVIAKLQGAHKLAVIEVFTGLLLRQRMDVAGATAKAMGASEEAIRSTGAFSFPGFSVSTAAPRATGWRARLSRWFAPTRR